MQLSRIYPSHSHLPPRLLPILASSYILASSLYPFIHSPHSIKVRSHYYTFLLKALYSCFHLMNSCTFWPLLVALQSLLIFKLSFLQMVQKKWILFLFWNTLWSFWPRGPYAYCSLCHISFLSSAWNSLAEFSWIFMQLSYFCFKDRSYL